MTSATLELNGAAADADGPRARGPPRALGPGRGALRARKPLGAIGGVIVVAMLLMAVFAEADRALPLSTRRSAAPA